MTRSSSLKWIGLSVALHAAVLGAFSLSMSLPSRVREAPPQVTDQPIQAIAVDAAAVQAEIERQQAKEAAARAAEEKRQRELAAQERAAREAREREERRLAQLAREREEAERRQQEEQTRLAALKQKQAEEAARLKKLQAEKAAAEKAAAEEKARLERERKAREEAERKRLAEEKRKAEEARKAAEAKARAEEERRKAEAEARRRQIEAEEAQQRMMAAIAGWANVVKGHLQRYWTLPPGSYTGRQSEVLIRMTPDGNVLSVRTVRSSGDPSFDRLAEATVQKASPIPMPQDANAAKALADQGAQIIFKPE